MNREKVVSREYKIMLLADKFAGDEQHVLRQAGAFWHRLKQIIEDFGIDTNGDLDTIEKRRLIRFYDAKAPCSSGSTDAVFRLRDCNGYVFRERIDLADDDREVTLKFRHPDRFISQDRAMDAEEKEDGKVKFEEDIKPGQGNNRFISLYSFSGKQDISDSKKLNKMNDPARLFPDLQEQLDQYDEEEALNRVGDFTAREWVITGATFQIRNKPKRDAECALIVWYDHEDDEEHPVVVEFSFRYQDDEEAYTRKMAQRAYNIFLAMQDRLPDWIDPNPVTKTKYVYNRAKETP